MNKKIEHSGLTKGQGAFWGRKAEAKAQSNRRRREQEQSAANPRRKG